MVPQSQLTPGFCRIEGVNDQSPNAMTLHTSANCNMPASRSMTGHATGNNCDVNTSNNAGCGVQAPTSQSYGPSFNAIGGGIYAMERTNNFIKVWFFPRNSNIPGDVQGAASINTDNWVSRLQAIPSGASLTNGSPGYSHRFLPQHQLQSCVSF